MMYRHGLRCSEAVDLRIDDVSFDRATLWVRRLKGSNSGMHPIEGDELRAILPFATDVARIGDARLAGADSGHGEPMLPAITKVSSVIDDGLSRLEHVAQAHLARRDARLCSPVVIHRQTVPLLADCELPEVVIEPSHDGLDDVVQDLERNRGRHLDLTPD